MKKIIISLFVFVFVAASVALANCYYYYVTRSGDILQKGTDIPIFKNLKMNLYCNVAVVKYGMERYVVIKDEGGPYTRKTILGCQDDSSSNIFDPFVVLNSDNVTEKITSDELKNANIRFANYRGAFGVIDIKNKKNDLDLEKIGYIDLNNLRFYSNQYAELYMYLRPKNESQFSNNIRYMKELLIEIRSIPLSYADRMIKAH